MTAMPPDWIVPAWPVPASVRALVTTRAGGISSGPYATAHGGGMNLGLHCGDDEAAVRANRDLLRRWLPDEPRWLRQVHGNAVVDAGAAPDGAEADAAWTDRPGVVAAVMMADCLPVLLADTDGRCVGVAHAGWRGLAAGVIEATVHAMRTRLGDPQAALVAWLGPAIGPDHFEVGADVLQAMSAKLDCIDAFVPQPDGRYRADLFALGRRALAGVGVTDVHGDGLCTFCDPVRFYSHRRDRVTGRHAALIWIEPRAATVSG
jgi:YfiH family protein